MAHTLVVAVAEQPFRHLERELVILDQEYVKCLGPTCVCLAKQALLRRHTKPAVILVASGLTRRSNARYTSISRNQRQINSKMRYAQ